MAPNCVQGAFSQMAMKNGAGPYTWSSGAAGFAFYRSSMQTKKTIVNPNVITGSRSADAERSRSGPSVHYGAIYLPVSPGDLATGGLAQRILGGTPSGTTYGLAETLPSFGVLLDEITSVFEWTGCVVDKAMFHGKQSGPGGAPNYIDLVLWVYAISSVDDATYPDLDPLKTAGYTPFVAEDTVLTLAGSARTPKEWWVLVDNHVDPRYVNAINPTLLCPTNRTVGARAIVPFDDDHEDLYDQAVAGAAGSLALINGTIGATFTFGVLQVPAESPPVPGKTELDLDLSMVARKTGSTNELTMTIDDTP